MRKILNYGMKNKQESCDPTNYNRESANNDAFSRFLNPYYMRLLGVWKKL